MIKTKTAYWLSAPILAILFGYVLYPTLHSLGLGLQIAPLTTFFAGWNAPNVQALWTSVWLSLLTVLGGGILGTSLAYLLYRFDLPLRRTLQQVATIPLALPPLVGVMAFLFLYGESGVLPRLVQNIFGLSKVPFAFEGFYAVLWVHIYSFFTYFYLFCTASLQGMDATLWEASADLGANGAQTFRRIILPALRPAITNAALLVFMLSMASFTAPLLFDGTGRYMTLQIYGYKTSGDLQMAATVSTLLTLICMAFLYFTERFPTANTSTSATKGTIRSATVKTNFAQKLVLMLILGSILIFLLLPVLMVILLSFAQEGSWTVQLLPQAYSFEHYMALFTQPDVAAPIVNSIQMGLMSTVANVLFGVMAAWLMVKTRIRGKMAIRLLTALPFAIPGTAVALNLILLFNTPSPLSLGQVWVGTIWILPVAYFIRQIPLVVRATVTGLENYDDRLTEASSDAGASAFHTFRRITLPLLMPAIMAGTLLTFITALGEFVASIMLYTTDNRPISVEIFAQLRQYNFGAAAAYSVFLMLLVMLSTWISKRMEGQKM